MKIDAILPAGGRIEGNFATEAGVELKALIRFSESTILERTVAALRATGQVERIVVIGPEELRDVLKNSDIQALLPEGASGPDNIYRGLDWLGDHGGCAHSVLVAATDLPFLSARSINEFLAACPVDADLCAPILRKDEFESFYPGLAGEYVRLREGLWTMGCTFLIKPKALLGSKAQIEGIFGARKSQFAMARLLGFLFLARFATKRLSLEHVQKRCEQILGCGGAGVLGCSPELAFDIDGLEEYRHALKLWNELA